MVGRCRYLLSTYISTKDNTKTTTNIASMPDEDDDHDDDDERHIILLWWIKRLSPFSLSCKKYKCVHHMDQMQK